MCQGISLSILMACGLPDHFHGLLNIEHEIAEIPVGIGRDQCPLRQIVKQSIEDGKYQLGPHAANLFAVMRAFKGICTMRTNKLRRNISGKSIWQSRFHDRVVRNEAELNRIRYYIKYYIKMNPGNYRS